MSNDLKNKIFFKYYFYLKKRYSHIKKINKYILKLKSIFYTKQKDNNLNLLAFSNVEVKTQNKKLLVKYIIHFAFSPINTFLYITDIKGNLKFSSSAGRVDFKGKQKKLRINVLKRFFSVLKQLKTSFLKDKPIALHFTNVGFYKHFIIKNLKKYFYIRIVKNYELYPYNGCRKKKKVRKRQRIMRQV